MDGGVSKEGSLSRSRVWQLELWGRGVQYLGLEVEAENVKYAGLVHQKLQGETVPSKHGYRQFDQYLRSRSGSRK